MRSHQISQISHFRIKYEFGISFKREIWEKQDKKRSMRKTRYLMMGYLLMKRKRRESHGTYNILWKKLRLKDRESFFR